EAGHARHGDVEDRHLGGVLAGGGQGGGAVRHRDHVEAGLLELVGDQVPDVLVVLGHEHCGHDSVPVPPTRPQANTVSWSSRGNATSKLAPPSGLWSARIVPPCCSTMSLA